MDTVQTNVATSRDGGRAVDTAVRLLNASGLSYEVELPSGRLIRGGAGTPQFRVVVHSMKALRRLDEFGIGQAYVEGLIDFEGDMLALLQLRGLLRDRFRIGAVSQFLWQLFFLPSTLINRKAIAHHYTLGDDFYLSFTDRDYHFYSHCVFHDDAETLEQAAEHKLEQMVDALRLEPGKRLLDIGGGWGAVIKYCAPRGIDVTSLTIVEDSYNHIQQQKQSLGLQGRVKLEDFLTHEPEAPYDAIVIYGVIEHIPMYRRFAEQVWKCLKPGGLLYLDASATKEKFDMNAFTRHYIWRGTHTFLCLQDMIAELLFAGMEIVRVKEETHDYELTMRHWAERFDAQHSMVASRWGEQVYRAYRLYLWAGCHEFGSGGLQAYHLVARRRADPGPRPGLLARTKQFVMGQF